MAPATPLRLCESRLFHQFKIKCFSQLSNCLIFRDTYRLTQLREYALRRNFVVMGEFIDYASGTPRTGSSTAAKKKKLDVVLVWRYDRFARSTQALVNAMKEFQSMRIDFISYHQNIDTTTSTGELIFHMMASLAQFESSLISQKAGIAKAQGKRISRPTLPIWRIRTR